MDAVFIEEWKTEYRLPARAVGELPRLDRVLNVMLDSFLESALEQIGISPADEICIREIRIPVQLRLSASDHALALEWAAALAAGVRRAIDSGDAEWVVHYRSRGDALRDFAAAVATRDLQKAWAWRQLGFGEVNDATAPDCLVAALTRENAIPVFVDLAERRLLGLLASRLTLDHWRSLGQAVASSIDVSSDVLRFRAPSAADAARRSVLQRAIEKSRIAAAAAEQLQPRLHVEEIRLVLAWLALLEVEPAVVRRPAAYVREVVGAVATHWKQSSDRSNFGARGGAIAEARRPASRTVADFVEPSSQVVQAARFSRSDVSTNRPATMAPDPSPSERRIASPTTGATRHGGLLYLIHVVDELKLMDELEFDEPFCRRPFRWALHRLAMTLSGIEPRDPAALAFAGLGPTMAPPSQDEESPSNQELRSLEEFRQRIVERARRRLSESNPKRAEEFHAMAADRLTDWICRRPARVDADPGWITAHFSLDDVSTEIRRAGLDLDPGYVPWLGVVLTYEYE
jgi:hypothetical protein